MGAAGAVLGIGGGIFGMMSQRAQAQRANENAMRAADSAAKMRAIKMQSQRQKRNTLFAQTMQKRDMMALKQARADAKARGKAKASSASAGLSTGSGSANQRIASMNAFAASKQEALSSQFGIQTENIRSAFEAGAIDSAAQMEQQINAAYAQMQDPTMAAIGGAISGVGSGLSIAGAGKDLFT